MTAPYDNSPQDHLQQPAGYSPQSQGHELPEHPKSTTVLVLGILGMIVFAPLGIAALVIGNSARREVAAGMYRSSGSLTAGWIMGIVATIFLILGLLLLLLITLGVLAS